MSGGPETVMTASRDQAFNNGANVTTPQNQNQNQNQQSNMQFAGYTAQGTPVYKAGGDLAPPPSQGGINSYIGSSSEPIKRKRGRPRKYAAPTNDGMGIGTEIGNNNSNMSFSIMSSSPVPVSVPAVADVVASGGGSSAAPIKKARGRPPGSTNKKHHLQPIGSVGAGFTPHVITVKAGEDVSSKIMSFSQHGSRAVCILSANGAISNATLRQPASSGGTVTYEGRFEILSLSGSFMLSEINGRRSRTGGLSVSLSGPDGRVLGGGVEGPLTAGSPLQIVIGSFIADDGCKEMKSGIQAEPLSAPTTLPLGSPTTGPSSPHSRGTFSESPGAPGSPLNQSTGACNNHSAQVMSNMHWK